MIQLEKCKSVAVLHIEVPGRHFSKKKDEDRFIRNLVSEMLKIIGGL